MWGRKSVQIQNNFFTGISFSDKLNESFFGKFIRIIKNYINTDINISNDIISQLQIPKVIVIGAESAGKSSLLENITKCPIFPRNSSICTKMPIHLKLNTNLNKNIKCQLTYLGTVHIINKNLLRNHIEDIMKTLPIDQISSDEIIIEINDELLPTFEFYDLPSIVAYPENLAKKTYELSEYYVRQNNMIIVCVIPATTPRITSYQPIGLIKKYNKESNTIIALTMSDRVQNENIVELLINRITKSTDEYDSEEFAGCVAVMNRSHKDSIQLSENDKLESDWFKYNILDCIPEDYPEEQTILLKKNITIYNLILNLDILYNNFIKSNWIPTTKNKLNHDLINIEVELFNLGDEPALINKNLLADFYNSYLRDIINHKIMSLCINTIHINDDRSENFNIYYNRLLNSLDHQILINNVLEQMNEDEEEKEDEDEDKEDEFEDEEEKEDKEDEEAKELIISKKFYNNYETLKIQRFEVLTKSYISSYIIEFNSKYHEHIECIKSNIMWTYFIIISDSKHNSKLKLKISQSELSIVFKSMINEINDQLNETFDIKTFDEFINLTESQEFIIQRNKLNYQMQQTKLTVDQIETLNLLE
jgi:hypothetical protein